MTTEEFTDWQRAIEDGRNLLTTAIRERDEAREHNADLSVVIDGLHEQYEALAAESLAQADTLRGERDEARALLDECRAWIVLNLVQLGECLECDADVARSNVAGSVPFIQHHERCTLSRLLGSPSSNREGPDDR